jgi:hypothetical protein
MKTLIHPLLMIVSLFVFTEGVLVPFKLKKPVQDKHELVEVGQNLNRRKLLAWEEPSRATKCMVINGICGCSVLDKCRVLSASSWIHSGASYDKIYDGIVGEGYTYLSALTSGDAWVRVSCPNTTFLGGLLEVKYSPVRMSNFEVWVGEDMAFPGTNTKCYNSVATVPSTMQTYYGETFACQQKGSYMYIAKRNINSNYFEIGEGQFYESFGVAGQIVYDNTCVCPAGQGVYNGQCSVCPAGFLLENGVCSICPLGMICAASLDPASCSPGSYCPAGTTAEVPCQAGFYCTTPSIIY